MITPCNFFICNITDWILDTDSPYHICNSLSGLQVSRRFEQDERFLNIGDGSLILILALGTIQLIFESRIVILDNYHYYPFFLINIISVVF